MFNNLQHHITFHQHSYVTFHKINFDCFSKQSTDVTFTVWDRTGSQPCILITNRNAFRISLFIFLFVSNTPGLRLIKN